MHKIIYCTLSPVFSCQASCQTILPVSFRMISPRWFFTLFLGYLHRDPSVHKFHIAQCSDEIISISGLYFKKGKGLHQVNLTDRNFLTPGVGVYKINELFRKKSVSLPRFMKSLV